MSHATLKWFKFEHLPMNLQVVSAKFYNLAEWIDADLADGPEKSAALRKLLEAKVCAVRAMIDGTQSDQTTPSTHSPDDR